ncbi:Phosphomevalonate kinase [Eumeta japonica]|uniref:Phosphomevalonate kinase n=1 Tax=Eumeta variegata TaxID=151549 RepID=A0A4C1T2P1_EUMVA|nr:Phosphomevalonate kinase [Eumeta japonica]
MGPTIILLFSGKRKSGKDYLTDKLKGLLSDKCQILKISEPIKSHWAKMKNLNLDDLLSDKEYKEQYRLEMINWSDEMREKDYGCFCRTACQNAPIKPIWIVSDIRRKTDIQWFKENYGDRIKAIRIIADDETRRKRGFEYKEGIDNVTSECDLDDYTTWDLVVDNGRNGKPLEEQLNQILELIKL